MPQRLRRVDVAESSDQALIEQRRFNRTAPRRQRVTQRLRRQRRIRRLRSKAKLERRTRRMNVDRAERPWVVKHDARSISKCEKRPRESRQLFVGAIDLPVAGHAEMRMHHAAVVEHDELVLSAPLDRADGRTGQRSKSRLRNASPKRSVKDVDARNRLTNDGVSQPARGTFDFGEFWHKEFSGDFEGARG